MDCFYLAHVELLNVTEIDGSGVAVLLWEGGNNPLSLYSSALEVCSSV